MSKPIEVGALEAEEALDKTLGRSTSRTSPTCAAEGQLQHERGHKQTSAHSKANSHGSSPHLWSLFTSPLSVHRRQRQRRH